MLYNGHFPPYFQEIISKDEIHLVENVLKTQKEDQFKSKQFDLFWHTVRALQSLTHSFVDKRIFCNDKNNIRVILCNFHTRRKHLVENIEIWTADLSTIESETLSRHLSELIEDFVNQGRVVIFRSMTNNVAGSLRKCLLEFPSINIAYEKHLDCKYLREDVNIGQNNCLDGFEIKRINPENAHVILEKWKYGHQLDKDWVISSIKDRPSMGIWDLSINRMVGHFMYLLTGTFGSLCVDNNYRRQGLAKLLIWNLAKAIRDEKMHFLIEIEDDNNVSLSLFKKLCFDKISESNYFVLNKTGTLTLPGEDF